MIDPNRHLPSCLTALLLVTLSSAFAQQPPGFSDTTDVFLVQIPVFVTLEGEPLRGLSERNFEVFEGKRKHKIVAVDVLDLTLTEAATRPVAAPLDVPAASRRRFLFLFDLSNSRPSGIVRAREASLALAEGKLHPSDLAAVATYSKASGARLILGFTTDRRQLAAALDSLGLVSPFDTVRDPLQLQIARIESALETSGRSTGLSGFDASEALLVTLKDLSTLSSRASRDQVKQQIADLSASLEELARYLDSAPGRKQVVFFSSGFDSSIVFGTQDSERIEEISRDVQEGLLWRVDPDERFGASDSQAGLLAMLESFRRSDCAIHAVDVAGLRAAGDVESTALDPAGSHTLTRTRDGLFLMADRTGGTFYHNSNDLGDAMQDLLERTSVTYVVSIQPRQEELDGRYHPLEVRLDNVPKGAQVSHRPGYFAQRPYYALDPTERQLETADLIIGGRPGGSIPVSVLAAPFAGDDSAAYVLTAIEIAGESLLQGPQTGGIIAEIYAYAFGADGRVRDFTTQIVDIDLAKIGYRLGAGFKLLGHLQLPPGDYELRTLVRDVRSGATGLAVSSLAVPDFAERSPVLLPPLFIEPADRWLLGEGKRQDIETPPYPLTRGERRLVPAARPLIPAGETIPLLLVGYNLPSDLESRAELRPLDGTGQGEQVQLDLDQRYPPSPSGVEHLTADLRAADLVGGDYELVVTLSTRAGADPITSSIAVIVF